MFTKLFQRMCHITAAVAMLSVSLTACADDAIATPFQIKLVVTEDYPPLAYINDKGEIAGTATTRVKEVLKLLGQKDRIQVLLWARAYEIARQNKDVLIFPMAPSPEREKLFKFAGLIDNVQTYFYKLKSTNLPKLKSLEDAKKYKICVIRADIRQQFLKSQGFTNLVEAYDVRQSMEDFVAGNCHLGAFSETAFIGRPSNVFIEQDQLDNVEKFYLIKEIDGRRYMAFSQDTSDTIVNAFRAAAAKIYKQSSF